MRNLLSFALGCACVLSLVVSCGNSKDAQGARAPTAERVVETPYGWVYKFRGELGSVCYLYERGGGAGALSCVR